MSNVVEEKIYIQLLFPDGTETTKIVKGKKIDGDSIGVRISIPENEIIAKSEKINEQFKQQLGEKEKEIEELKEKLYWTENGVKLALLMNKHKICEEIREKLKDKELLWHNKKIFDAFTVKYIIDEIEGEK